MATEIGNTAVEPAMLRQDSRDKYAPANLMLYRTSLALVKNLVNEGIFSVDEYDRIRAILNEKYNLLSSSIFAESA